METPIILAVSEILLGVVIFILSLLSYIHGGRGNAFKVYAACVCVLNTVIALCR